MSRICDVKFSEQKDRFCAEFGDQSDPLEAAFKDVGVKGASAYEIAVMRGFKGTVDEWLDSLHGKDGKPGAPGKNGEPFTYDDFTDEQIAALKGKDGKPGKDGYTPVRGEDYWTETDKQEIVEEVLEKVPSGGGGAAIIDVIALPTENIDEDSFYRLLTGTFVYDQYTQNNMICHCVESLPETGEPAVSGDLSNLENATITTYYNTQDGSVSAYVTDMLSGAFGVPAGWYPAAVLMNAVGFAFSGVITNIMDDPMDGTFRLLLEYVVYSYKDGWTSLKPIGKAGTGPSAEVFNHPSNTASGNASHAEGYATTASGNASHAEGFYSHTEGYSSHAEGYSSHAQGFYSHAEGNASHAEGDSSHAEGDASHAEGNASHAEGNASHAVGRSQHVQGEFNIVDPEYDATNPSKRGKYAHIVGNGKNNLDRSNAHTLDWEGNAWFAGNIYIGGMGQDDPNAKKLSVGGGGGASVQADWNQNDPEQPDFVKNRPFYEVPTNYEITWDGDMTGRTAIDLSILGAAGVYLVKVSDKVYTKEELIGKHLKYNDGDILTISNDSFVDYPGAFVEAGFLFGSIYFADELNAALGAPDGYCSNGTYFSYYPSGGLYAESLFTEGYIEKLENKFLPDSVLNTQTVNHLERFDINPDTGWAIFPIDISEGSPWKSALSAIENGAITVTISLQVNENSSFMAPLRFILSYYNGIGAGQSFHFRSYDRRLFTVYLVVDTGIGEVRIAAKTVAVM